MIQSNDIERVKEALRINKKGYPTEALKVIEMLYGINHEPLTSKSDIASATGFSEMQVERIIFRFHQHHDFVQPFTPGRPHIVAM